MHCSLHISKSAGIHLPWLLAQCLVTPSLHQVAALHSSLCIEHAHLFHTKNPSSGLPVLPMLLSLIFFTHTSPLILIPTPSQSSDCGAITLSAFGSSTAHNNHALQAEDELDQQEWMEAIQGVTACLLNGDVDIDALTRAQPKPARPTHSRQGSRAGVLLVCANLSVVYMPLVCSCH